MALAWVQSRTNGSIGAYNQFGKTQGSGRTAQVKSDRVVARIEVVEERELVQDRAGLGVVQHDDVRDQVVRAVELVGVLATHWFIEPVEDAHLG